MQLYFLLPLFGVQNISKQIDVIIVCFKCKMSIKRRPVLPFPFIVEISSPFGGSPLFSFVHVLAKLERPYYLIILEENGNFLAKAKYDVESSTLQLKSEIFPALTPAAVH